MSLHRYRSCVSTNPADVSPNVEGSSLVDVNSGTEPASEAKSPEFTPLREPADGVPDIVDTPAALSLAVRQLASGSGPIAVDAERASGYRYGQRAYLLQFRRQGSGTVLIDPIACPDLASLDAVIGDVEWVLHAASQDLPCLREAGLTPRAGLFDTELAARLLGRARVGLGPLVESVLGLSLAKEHSAVNWSKRPLPQPWLRYAALDVEVLNELRDQLERELVSTGKREWAHQEFEHVIRMSQRPEQRADRWRRTSGLNKVRGQRALAVVRGLWEARDAVAARRDIHPVRVLADAALCEAAIADARSAEDLKVLPAWRDRGVQRDLQMWSRVIHDVHNLREEDLPVANPPSDAPPPPRTWADRDPAAHVRLQHAKALIARISDEISMPAENLVTPDFIRRLAWDPPAPMDRAALDSALSLMGARPWQRGLLIDGLEAAFQSAALGHPVPTEAPLSDGDATPEELGADSPSQVP
jgi:ribonuclease D